MNNQTAFSSVEEETALTAMCIWEALLERMSGKDCDNVYSQKREEVGACEMRSIVLHLLAPAVEAAYEVVKDEYQDPFDWEFVPAFLELAEPVLSRGLWAITSIEAEQIGKEILLQYQQVNGGGTDE
ncbi:hypothetical protein O0V09_14910 [Dasania sp. GY-19]|uniref:Uncharacterized protein n=1 Tax=Dasania phycosphaerae TaxID=2950436 RepID=A0A9J6RPR6_9GAMM|nr:hypothetical protein [Dasania phycosphaerae]MCZ0866500.1 hypothetical protein [Dasania phycosphaerae]